MIPTATYRIQLSHQLKLRQVAELIDYFQELGISHLYTSPLTKAHTGSLHGYDVIDHGSLNPELGSEEDLSYLAAKLRERGMGLIQDIVPNHMFLGNSSNQWWNDVLENGPSSPFAEYFDIDWNPPREELANKILLPILNQQYGDALENQLLKVCYLSGSFFLEYSHFKLPLNPRSWPLILQPSLQLLTKQLNAQDVHLLELQSIITALVHLPRTIDTDPEKVKERLREKEIIKTRLGILLKDSDLIRTAVYSSLEKLNGIKANPHSFDQLEEFLTHQPYRLCFWRVANDEINFRRFFDICDFGGIRTENPTVFGALHQLVWHFIEKGWVQGLRIDHLDGLLDPQKYLTELQQGCFKASGLDKPPFYVVAEKILVGDEQLRSEWSVSGTVGYDFLNLVNGLFIRAANRNAIEETYQHFIGRFIQHSELTYQCKMLTLLVAMSSELHVLARHLDKIKEQHRSSRDITLESLRQALRAIIASFPVYRSYIYLDQPTPHQEDQQNIMSAVEQAKWHNPAMNGSIFDFIKSVLLLEWPEGLNDTQKAEREKFVLHFQQLTAPVMAIGVENTAFYRYYPLSSICEVGADLNRFSTSLDLFHQKNQERLERWPHTLLTTSTHDTKRSEDVRARINVLSEIPSQWNEKLWEWHKLNLHHKQILNGREAPDQNEEYLLYQTIIGTWPLYPMDDSAHAHYTDRIDSYMNKAMREAKIHTSWINPYDAYEKAVQQFVHAILNVSMSASFLESLKQFLPPVFRCGMLNSLSQIVLKMTVPGVPDFYQGNEFWTFDLVDPDNRRPVNYAIPISVLAGLKDQEGAQLTTSLEDGRIKIYVTSRTLELRKRFNSLFQSGRYIPLEISGERKEHLVAFMRTLNEQAVITLAGRFFAELSEAPDRWQDTRLILPQEFTGTRFRDIYTGITYDNHGDIPIGNLLAQFSVAVLEKTQ